MCIIGRRWRKRLRDCSFTSWIELAGNLALMESGGLQMGGTVYEPLAGVKVLSFEIAFALPAGTRTLAELGAEVVRVPPPARDVGNYIGVVDGAGLLRKCRSRRRGSEGPGTTFQLVRTPEGARSPPTTFSHISVARRSGESWSPLRARRRGAWRDFRTRGFTPLKTP